MLSDSNHDESKSLGSEFPARTFATTHWSVVLEAADTANAGANEALERLCTTYWYPLYAYVRRQGYSPQDAEDLIQSFLARVLDRNLFRLADPNRGRFRSFLLGVLKHFLSDERKKATAQKRGGGAMLIPLDSVLAERQYEQETATREMSAEMLFDRRWALTVLQRAADRQRAEYVTAGNETLYGSLKQFQGGEREGASYAEVASHLGMTESAVKSAIYRFRSNHKEILREEVANTLSNPLEVDEEIRYLIQVLASE